MQLGAHPQDKFAWHHIRMTPLRVVVEKEKMTAEIVGAEVRREVSRSGFLGLIAMGLVVIYYTARIKPGIVFGVLVAGLLALPVMPSSFWNRMDSIMNAEEDATGMPGQILMQGERGKLIDAKLGRVPLDTVVKVKEF